MAKIIVSGLINVETTLKIDEFPLQYNPVNYPFYGVETTVSGVGYNIAKALNTLGDDVHLLSIIGQDLLGNMVLDSIGQDGISSTYIQRNTPATAQSVILYDESGQRQIHVDLKSIQETAYPVATFEHAMQDCDAVVLSNINFSRPLLKAAKRMGKPIATDVHEISELNDPYNYDFMKAADILFMSSGSLKVEPKEWIQQLQGEFGTSIIVVSLGENGALLAEYGSGEPKHFPSVKTRPVINTIGAGDALLSSFLHFYVKENNAEIALRNAMVFASYKIGERGGASGFLSETDFDFWLNQIYPASEK